MIIDNIDSILDIIKEDNCYNFFISLTGTPANGNYPKIKISIDGQLVWSGQVIDAASLKFTSIVAVAPCIDFEIQYYNKLDNDTVVNKDGTIIENQSVKINSLEINNLLISGNQLMEYSSTNYMLTDGQKDAYNSNNFPWEGVKTDTLWNNGTWQIKLQRPVIANLTKQKYVARQVFELSHLDILSKLQNYFRE
jgi:hypothetical protein